MSFSGKRDILGLASGLRQGELITLPWATFDLDHHRLILPRRWVKLTEQIETIIQQEQKLQPDSTTIFQDARTEQPLSDATIRHIMILLRQILRQAVSDRLMEKRPMIDLNFYETKHIKYETLTTQEVADYLDAAGQLGYGAMFTLAIHYGLRQRELIALKWSDVDMKKNSLTVHAERVVKEGKLVEYAGKVRELQLSPEDAALLEQEHAKHPSSEVLFIHPGTLKPYTPNMVRLRHNWILDKAEIPHIRFEDLHHTCAVLALQNGMTAAELTHLQGH